MNQKVTDISETLQTMAEEMRFMRETIDSQHADICQLNRNIDRLNADLRKRDKRIEELEAKLAKYEAPDKNSGNSSTRKQPILTYSPKRLPFQVKHI